MCTDFVNPGRQNISPAFFIAFGWLIYFVIQAECGLSYILGLV